MKKLFLITALVSLSACKLPDWLGGESGGSSSSSSSSAKPPRGCRQQTDPRDPTIPCKPGDWHAPGDAKCSSTKEKCEAKG